MVRSSVLLCVPNRNLETVTVITGTVASNTILFILPVSIYLSLSPAKEWLPWALNILFLVVGVAIGASGLVLHFFVN